MHDVLKEGNIIGCIANFLAVQDDLVRLASLGEPCNHLVRHIGSKVSTEG